MNKKQGYQDPITGLIFIGRAKGAKNNEWWVTPEKFEKYLERKRLNSKKFRTENTERYKQHARKSYRKNIKKRKAERRKYYDKNKEDLLAKNKIWVNNNRDRIRKYMREYNKKRAESDPIFLVTRRARTRVQDAFRHKGFGKNTKTAKMLGCSWEQLRDYIENQFVDGMTWENRNLWHIDHIVPLSSAKTIEELEKLCHYTNLQPLWALDNMSKGAKLVLDKTLEKEEIISAQ